MKKLNQNKLEKIEGGSIGTPSDFYLLTVCASTLMEYGESATSAYGSCAASMNY